MLGVAATYLGPAERPPAITRMALPRLPARADRVPPRANDNTPDRRVSNSGLARDEHQPPTPVDGVRQHSVERLEKPQRSSKPPGPTAVTRSRTASPGHTSFTWRDLTVGPSPRWVPHPPIWVVLPMRRR